VLDLQRRVVEREALQEQRLEFATNAMAVCFASHEHVC